jgi:polyhomeotic-like protein 1
MMVCLAEYVAGSQVTGNGVIPTKEEKVLNGCVEMSITTNVMENGVAAEEVRTERERERERDKNPPKAMVKPQVLTHVIEGFVIQEGMQFNYNSNLCLLYPD